MPRFPFYQQPDAMDCGPTCLRMIAKYYGCTLSLQTLRIVSETARASSSLLHLSKAAEKIGFRSLGGKINFQKLMQEVPLPCIISWQQDHFVVVHKIKKTKFL